MTFCVDDVWKLFQKFVTEDEQRLAFAKELIRISEYENLSHNCYCAYLMEFLAEHDDEYFLEFHCFDDDSSIDEVVEGLKFHMEHNGLSSERRDRLMNLWMKNTGNYDPETRTQLLQREKEALENRIRDIDVAIGDWKK